MTLPTVEQFQEVLKDLMYEKHEHEGAKTAVAILLYTVPQVDTIVELIGGWENLADAIANRSIVLNIVSDYKVSAVGVYVTYNLSLCKENVRAASFEPIKPVDHDNR